ncbi:putative reverse transcriptase, RNA-dependent DNA polymerase [Tanacetum coccineum]
MDSNSSLGKICLGENVIVISSDKVEGSGDWNSQEFQDTANSGQKKETKAMVFYQMDTEEVSDRFVAPCFVKGLEAYDGEINLGVEENMISNEYVVKLCLEHEVKRGNKVVENELIVALRGEIYFVKFIINPEEDDVELGVIFGRSFLCMTKAITDFGVGTVIIYPNIDPFLEETKEEERSNDDWDHLLDFNLDDVPVLGEEELPPFVCRMGKSSRNKKWAMENLNFFYQDIGTSSSAGGHLTQEDAVKEALAIKMSQKFALLKEERPIIETMAYHDKYKKIFNEVWKEKVELDGKIIKEEEEAVKRIKGEALKEKDDPGAFIFPIRLEGHVNENALADTGLDINTMRYRIYEQLWREDMKKVYRGITMINHTQAEAMGILTNVLCQVGVTTLISKFLILDIPIDRDAPIVVGRGFLHTIGGIVNTPERLFLTFDGFCHQTFCATRSDVMRNAESDSDDEEEYQIKRNKFGAPIYGPKLAPYLNYNDPAERSLWERTMMRPDHHDPNALDNMKPWKRYCFHKFTMSSYYGKDVTELQSLGCMKLNRMKRYSLLWRGLELLISMNQFMQSYATSFIRLVNLTKKFVAAYELQTKKIIKFRLGGRAHSLTLLEFARRLGLYHVVELEEDGFNVYFEGGLRSDEHFNAQEYWLSISREENLGLSRSHTSTIRNLILRVIHKMITYGLYQRTTGYDKIQKNDLWLLSMFDSRHQNGYANVAWLIVRWIKRKGTGTQKESQICCGQFISKIARKCRVLTEDVVRSLSAPIYCRDLDSTSLMGFGF